jgi:hypothetical protein
MIPLDYDRSSSSNMHRRASHFRSTKKSNKFLSLLLNKKLVLTFRPPGIPLTHNNDACLPSRVTIVEFEASKKQFQARKASKIDCKYRTDWLFQAIYKS